MSITPSDHRPISRLLAPLLSLLVAACPAVCGAGLCGGCDGSESRVETACGEDEHAGHDHGNAPHGHRHGDDDGSGVPCGGQDGGCPADCGGCFCDGVPLPADGPEVPAATAAVSVPATLDVWLIAGRPAADSDRRDHGPPPGRAAVTVHAGLLL